MGIYMYKGKWGLSGRHSKELRRVMRQRGGACWRAVLWNRIMETRKYKLLS